MACDLLSQNLSAFPLGVCLNWRDNNATKYIDNETRQSFEIAENTALTILKRSVTTLGALATIPLFSCRRDYSYSSDDFCIRYANH